MMDWGNLPFQQIEKMNENPDAGFEGDGETEKPDPLTLLPDLYEAAKENDTNAVLSFLEDGVPPVYVDESCGWTALHWAAMFGNIKMLEKLIEKGASHPYHKLKLKKASSVANPTANAKQGGRFSSSFVAQKGEDNASSLDNFENAEAKEESTGGETKKRLQRNVVEMDDNDDEDDPNCPESLLKNTPLLWAAFKGHLRVVWMLLVDNYSPNDVDNMGNNALHLAAVNGHFKVLKVLIDDGGSANMVNFYKNRPIDMATNKEIREALTVAMEKGASYTAADVQQRHEQNMSFYNKLIANLNRTILEARKIESSKYLSNAVNIPDVTRNLSDAVSEAVELSINEELVAFGELLIKKLDCMQDLLQDAASLVKNCTPMRSQSQYVEYVHKLEASIEKAKAAGLEKPHLQPSIDLISRSNIELWLETMVNRLKEVPIAKDCHEHDMNRLKAAIQKAQALKASDSLIDSSRLLYDRLNDELTMYRALQAIPTVRLPMENPPEGYYQECDLGHIQETEGFPLPPADGVYVWIPSASFTALTTNLDALKKVLAGCDPAAVNPALVAEAKERVVRADKDVKHLEVKDAADKQAAIDIATKAAKKLKKHSKKKKETKE